MTQLMLATGIDVIVVSSLESIRIDSTDHLCLRSLPTDSVLLSWLSFEEAAAAWRRLELDGTIQAMVGSPITVGLMTMVGNAQNRLRYFRLTPDCSVDQVVEDLKRVLDERQVKTVAIQFPGKMDRPQKHVASDGLTPVKEVADRPSKSASTTDLAPDERRSSSHADLPTNVDSADQNRNSQAIGQSNADRDHLDQLVDDLDALNL